MTSTLFPQRVSTGTLKPEVILQNNLEFLRDAFDKYRAMSTSGTATVIAAGFTVDVLFPSKMKSPKLSVVPLGDPGGRWWVSNKSADGFTINLEVAAPVGNLDFDWTVKGV